MGCYLGLEKELQVRLTIVCDDICRCWSDTILAVHGQGKCGYFCETELEVDLYLLESII